MLVTHHTGILNINKPIQMTSHDVIKQVRKLTGVRKAGHAGTLDPLATGVLLVCLGQTTRLIEYLTAEIKVYRATILLGQATNTYDAEGEITQQADPSGLTRQQIEQTLEMFIGRIQQVPPAFSAIKKQGVPLYRLARQGITVEPDPRTVHIETIEPVCWNLPELILDVTCHAGTYIRSLAHDLGQHLGVGAHLAGLVRLQSGAWSVSEAISLEDLAFHCQNDSLIEVLKPKEAAVHSLPSVHLSQAETSALCQGQAIDQPQELAARSLADQPIAGFDQVGKLVAILQLSADGLLKPKKVFQAIS
ncbi:MAG: tRNA pseudouridine(55) synthase TruB [Chloroflexota bacterium]